MARTIKESVFDLKVSLKEPLGKSSVSYSRLINDSDDETLYNFAKGIMALQANPGTNVTVKRDYLLEAEVD